MNSDKVVIWIGARKGVATGSMTMEKLFLGRTVHG
jgi:hypothetical protein